MIANLFSRSVATSELDEAFAACLGEMPLLARLDTGQRARLADMAREFVERKAIEGAGGQKIDARVRAITALQACLPVLELGLELYQGWHSLILYPDEFRAPYEDLGPGGVVQEGSRDLSGEAWHRGPVVLAWGHVHRDGLLAEPDGNVVIHEMAHKLDMLNGDVNGMPPLHRDMEPKEWSRNLQAAYDDLGRHLAMHREPAIDPYAHESPGEFFAVASELFFAWPESLWEAYPEVYRQLAAYYRQNPLAAQEHGG